MARQAIDRRENGRYRARYEGPDLRWHSRTFDRKADAKRWLTDQLATSNQGRWIDPNAGQVDFAHYSTAWLTAKTRIKEKTHAGYQSLLESRILPTFGRARLVTIDRSMVGSWVRGMTEEKLSPSRIRQAHQCLAAILEQAVDDGLIGRNPARRVELPRLLQPDHRYLTADQVTELADAMTSFEHRTMVYVLAYGGLRWGELAALRRGRVDVLRRRLDIKESIVEISGVLSFGTPKTYQTRTVHLPAFVAAMVGHHLENVEDDPTALVFTAPRGGPLRYSNTRRGMWDPARSRAGADLQDITPHDLRHTCASLMRAAGADVKAIQQQLGHQTATVTLNTYTHLFEGDLDEVMDRLDASSATKSRPERVLGDVVDLPPRTGTLGT
ncbi:MAG: tyrosine-type recombinase/integrase [Actinomycetota bacterium]|nr:tyrosine-type recombinase/integrase [Actinomycetota bacterium]